MLKINYNEFEKAIETLGLIGLENKSEIKSRYLILSKKYHPDMPDGDNEKFQEINKAYKLISSYVDNFKFHFTKEEFSEQHPFSVPYTGKWLYGDKRQ
jgi:DnaJ-class molecular chaperone